MPRTLLNVRVIVQNGVFSCFFKKIAKQRLGYIWLKNGEKGEKIFRLNSETAFIFAFLNEYRVITVFR